MTPSLAAKKAAKAERSFYVTLCLAVLSGLAIGVMAFGAKHPKTPALPAPAANAPKPSTADAPTPDTPGATAPDTYTPAVADPSTPYGTPQAAGVVDPNQPAPR